MIRRPNRRRSRAVTVAGLAAALLAGTTSCGLGTAGGFSPTGTLAGPLAGVKTLDGTPIAVGSKNFTEQIVLGKMLVILLQSAGADVDDLTNIPGSASSRQAMIEGQLDAAWEYTGTGWISYLGQTKPIPDEKQQYDAVRDFDLQRNRLVWLPPAPMNNTYAFATRQDTAAKLGVKTLSDLSKVAPAQRTFCVDSEFAARSDGFQPMLKTYGLTYGQDVPASSVKRLAEGAIYGAVDSGQCTFGEVFTTDGRIKALDLAVLEDDKNFFPKYNASVVVRQEKLDEVPQVAQLIAPVAAKLDDQTLIDLNARVDVDGEEPVDVAWDWLRQEGFVSG
ncbi:glycine betaine ABC transporter substrate-binding protein [Agilicoccus flavus]|uniref:glycine betaine ABC transporter substrate-binding protein n=1 Tax=Agilicoccus flavus TaxID=2775968 RepID=UPI001CF6C7EB|nr:glycine betaine ABC transporter substrate-binding protein [Agilicoccus flavus]